ILLRLRLGRLLAAVRVAVRALVVRIGHRDRRDDGQDRFGRLRYGRGAGSVPARVPQPRRSQCRLGYVGNVGGQQCHDAPRSRRVGPPLHRCPFAASCREEADTGPVLHVLRQAGGRRYSRHYRAQDRLHDLHTQDLPLPDPALQLPGRGLLRCDADGHGREDVSVDRLSGAALPHILTRGPRDGQSRDVWCASLSEYGSRPEEHRSIDTV
ncbi:hypothetical protein PENTCL1PPCAC_13890, partial [Pristionchus entomophagus]